MANGKSSWAILHTNLVEISLNGLRRPETGQLGSLSNEASGRRNHPQDGRGGGKVTPSRGRGPIELAARPSTAFLVKRPIDGAVYVRGCHGHGAAARFAAGAGCAALERRTRCADNHRGIHCRAFCLPCAAELFGEQGVKLGLGRDRLQDGPVLDESDAALVVFLRDVECEGLTGDCRLTGERATGLWRDAIRAGHR